MVKSCVGVPGLSSSSGGRIYDRIVCGVAVVSVCLSVLMFLLLQN